jgi:KUP system potassium uptake protein
MFIPSINWLLCFGCIGVVLYFKESSHMEAAYGLSIIITMIMTTILLTNYLSMKHYNIVLIILMVLVYCTIEFSFLIANLSKFPHGGWVTIFIAVLIMTAMTVWYKARKILYSYVEFVSLKNYVPIIDEMSKDKSLDKYATHLVYLTSANNPDEIEAKIIYSILRKKPKKADVYWFIHVDVTDEPHTKEYKLMSILPGKIVRIDIRLGFREVPLINKYFREIVANLKESDHIDLVSRYASLHKNNIVGDFKFIVMKKYLSLDNEMPIFQTMIMNIYFLLKNVSLSEEKEFGLDTSSVKIERVPVIVVPPKDFELNRLK